MTTDTFHMLALDLTPECAERLMAQDLEVMRKWVGGCICFDFGVNPKSGRANLLMNDCKFDPVLKSHMEAIQRRLSVLAKENPQPKFPMEPPH